MQYARRSPRKPRKGLFPFRYSFIPPRHGKRRTSENRRRVFVRYLEKGQKGTFLIRFRGAMRGTFLLSGGFPGRKRRAFQAEENGRKRQFYRKPPKIAYQEGGVTIKRTPGRTARRGAVSMLRFEYTYSLTPKTPKAPRTRRKYRTFLAFSIFCDIIRTRNINNTRYCFYVCDTKTTTKKTSERKVKAL